MMAALVANTFQSVWDNAVTVHGKSTFLVFSGDTGTDTEYTYEDFDILVARTAGKLQELGVGSGDAVHVSLKNSPAFLLVWLAVARLGAWMVSVDPASTPSDVAKQLQRTKAVAGVVSAEREAAYRAGAEGRLENILVVAGDERDTLPGSVLLGAPAPKAEVLDSDRLAVLFTSGTTSEPKGVILTQANFAHLSRTMSASASVEASHRWFVTLPLFHANAQFYCFAPAIGAGASVALTAKFSASRWTRQAAQLKVTHASLFAAPIRMILARTPEDGPTLNLQHVWFAQSLGQDHYADFSRLVGCPPRQLYGMTETVSIVTADMRPEPSCDTIGTVIPGRDVFLADPFDFTPVKAGEPGVIMVGGERGLDLFAEYLDNPEANAASFLTIEGREWFRTGDLAQRGTDGLLRFVGRIDDVIKVSGENVSLTEVEAAVAQAPGVLEAAVLAIADPIRDQVPVAYIVAKTPSQPPTADELDAWALINLTPQARPRQWHIIDELPRTSVGKIRRFKLTPS
jgi:carnitine-CoA ligase